MFRRPQRPLGFFCFFHECFVIGQTGGVVQQISNGDGFPVGWEIRENFGERFIVAQLAVMNQQHDSHGGKLLGERGQAKIRSRIDFFGRTQFLQAITFAKENVSVLLNQSSHARLIVRHDSG
jgi:hypothetical protein